MSLKIYCETIIDSEPCVIAWNKQLYVGTDDGFIKSFDDNLSAGASWLAHAVQLFALAAGDEYLYSSSNDGGIRVWTHKGDKVAELPNSGSNVSVLRVHNKLVYAGDEAGNVLIYENNEEKAIYNVLEEVKDVAISNPFIFTVRDLDVTVTEIKPDESKNRFTTQHTMEGRAPLKVTDRYLLVVNRPGTHLQLHENSIVSRFKKVDEIKVSDMIITSLAANAGYVWTGGWDGVLRCFKLNEDKLIPAGEVTLGSCINGIATDDTDSVYAVLAAKKVVKVKAVVV